MEVLGFQSVANIGGVQAPTEGLASGQRVAEMTFTCLLMVEVKLECVGSG
jgi:hypothetical protein